MVGETLFRGGSEGVTGQKGACEVADGGYDYGEIVAAVPKAIVRRLITEDLDGFSWTRKSLLVGNETYQHETNDN